MQYPSFSLLALLLLAPLMSFAGETYNPPIQALPQYECRSTVLTYGPQNAQVPVAYFFNGQGKKQSFSGGPYTLRNCQQALRAEKGRIQKSR